MAEKITGKINLRTFKSFKHFAKEAIFFFFFEVLRQVVMILNYLISDHTCLENAMLNAKPCIGKE